MYRTVSPPDRGASLPPYPAVSFASSIRMLTVDPQTSDRSIQKVRRLSDILDRLVIGVLRRNEFGAGEIAENGRIVDREERGPHPFLEAAAEGLIDVAPDRPLVVRERRRLPHDRNLLRIEFAGLLVEIEHGIVQHAGLIGAG